MSTFEYWTPHQIVDSGHYPFTMGQIRHLLLYRHRNGLQNAVRKVGKRLVVRMDLFNRWIDEQKEENMGEFYLDNDGVWYQGPPNKKGELPTPTWVCSPLEILAITRDQDNTNYGKLLCFCDYDGDEHKWAMPMELLAGDGAIYRQSLLSNGMKLSDNKVGRELLSRYIQNCNPKERMRCVNKLGWYGRLYVLPQETIGISSDEEVVFQGNVPLADHHTSKGTLEEWQENVSKYCSDNSRLCFCTSVGFAAPLLNPLGEENGGFNLRGPSSGGKTTALKVALSIYGGEKMLQSWRVTSNGLEAIAALYNDNLLCLDELGKLEPKIAGETAYLLVNGGGKQRSDRSGFARKKQSWKESLSFQW